MRAVIQNAGIKRIFKHRSEMETPVIPRCGLNAYIPGLIIEAE
jgi:hypothetical protein